MFLTSAMVLPSAALFINLNRSFWNCVLDGFLFSGLIFMYECLIKLIAWDSLSHSVFQVHNTLQERRCVKYHVTFSSSSSSFSVSCCYYCCHFCCYSCCESCCYLFFFFVSFFFFVCCSSFSFWPEIVKKSFWRRRCSLNHKPRCDEANQILYISVTCAPQSKRFWCKAGLFSGDFFFCTHHVALKIAGNSNRVVRRRIPNKHFLGGQPSTVELASHCSPREHLHSWWHIAVNT